MRDWQGRGGHRNRREKPVVEELVVRNEIEWLTDQCAVREAAALSSRWASNMDIPAKLWRC